MKTIGFIGVGVMGRSMVRNLMKAGFELHIYARTREKVADIIEEGAVFVGYCRVGAPVNAAPAPAAPAKKPGKAAKSTDGNLLG